ncbi:biopolymer transporter ExbB [Caulobacter vibrioides]|nr:biopolymer transporter ExbB [Caulobacter vibrioides]
MRGARALRGGLKGFVFAALLAVAAAAPTGASAWWDKTWAYRSKIDIDTTAKGVAINGAIGRAPLLLRLHSGNFRFEDAAENGADLRFVAADDKTPLAYHIESFDPLLGVATVWVDIPEFPVGASRAIWMYYGAKDAAAAVDTAATFDADYAAVFHFDAATGVAPKDKTANANNAQTPPTSTDEGSVIGRGGRFAGGAPMTVAASPSLALAAGAPFTVSVWVRPDAIAGSTALVARREGAQGLVIGLQEGVPFVEIGASRLAAPAALGQGKWSHLAVVSDGRTAVLYVDGREAVSGASDTPALNTAIAVGADAPGGGLASFVGGIDELRFSKSARAPALIQMDAASQGAESRLATVVGDEKQSGAGFGPFGVIVKSVTFDAWVIIAILGLMGAASFWVIWSKSVYVGRVDAANDRFVKLFREHGDDLLALSHPDRLGRSEARTVESSSIYRIYRAGADEIERRRQHGSTVLRAEAIQVIRALMDATLVRENQRLAKSLVILTIAISGGPFLGLLGTVVGVMITFAAIAAAGDVNVNAIAPGISAALLATVAGLGVAIPALFGYNYVVTRNKSVQANMLVFVDEFITRASERYSASSFAEAAE